MAGKGRVVPVACVAALALAGGSAAAPWRAIGHGSASGDFALAAATAKSTHPSALAVAVTAARRAEADVTAYVACSDDAGSVGVRKTTFRARTPFTRTLLLPVPRGGACSVTASVAALSGGALRLRILAR
jgi:hypothetical protein